MNILGVKADKWKIFCLVIIGLLVLTIVLGYALHKGRKVQLMEEEKQLAVDVATEALAGRITDEFTPNVRDYGWMVKLESGETTTLAFVYFSAVTETRRYRVAVDLEGGKAVQITENRGWMAEGRRMRPGLWHR
ncbi:MAG: hypothetical protein V3T58_06025 [Candidatus Hydrothermarchaeales archaeon]